MDLLPLTEQYLKTLTEKEMKAYEIAKDHLGSSFELEKSVGYLKWLSKQQSPEKNN
jgi:hypothetical protein